ncbi:MAG: T9SS type A sorting domain-containing protein, partial [Flavobacteriaceae bacterium]
SFGEFSRNLSNDSEDIILRDAYGNIIDEVTYKDSLPWPEDADGNGAFLKLVSLDLDNSLASSWIAQDDTAENLSVNSFQFGALVSLYPNPVSDKLKINSANDKIKSIKLWSVNGKLYDTYILDSQQFELDMSSFENGLYLLQIQTNTESVVKKIIKN